MVQGYYIVMDHQAPGAWMTTDSGAYLLHAPGAVCISNMILEHIWLRVIFQIINGPGP